MARLAGEAMCKCFALAVTALVSRHARCFLTHTAQGSLDHRHGLEYHGKVQKQWLPWWCCFWLCWQLGAVVLAELLTRVVWHLLLSVVAACRQDVEIEMDRFENTRDATLAKYRMMQRPKGKLSDGLNLAVDGIATLCMGESAAVKPELTSS
jgi:hypothetical protein